MAFHPPRGGGQARGHQRAISTGQAQGRPEAQEWMRSAASHAQVGHFHTPGRAGGGWGGSSSHYLGPQPHLILEQRGQTPPVPW